MAEQRPPEFVYRPAITFPSNGNHQNDKSQATLTIRSDVRYPSFEVRSTSLANQITPRYRYFGLSPLSGFRVFPSQNSVRPPTHVLSTSHPCHFAPVISTSHPCHFERSEKSAFSDVRYPSFEVRSSPLELTRLRHHIVISGFCFFRVFPSHHFVRPPTHVLSTSHPCHFAPVISTSHPCHFERSEKSAFPMSDIRASKSDQVLLS